MIAADTSVVVASFASWHEFHTRALEVLERDPHIPVHAALETYSVLTRLPAPHRAAPHVVEAFLRQNFADRLISFEVDRFMGLLAELAQRGIVGGATYDAHIAATVRESGRVLVTFDERARRTYEQLGVTIEYAGPV